MCGYASIKNPASNWQVNCLPYKYYRYGLFCRVIIKPNCDVRFIVARPFHVMDGHFKMPR